MPNNLKVIGAKKKKIERLGHPNLSILNLPDDVLQKRVVCIKCDIDLRFHY
jgi:hypothetical protein